MFHRMIAVTRRFQARSAVLLVLVGAVADLAEAMDEDSPRQAVACFALVEFPAGLTAQFRIPQPVEGEQRAFQPPQLAQCRGEAVLPRVGGELPQDQGGGDGARTDRGGNPQDFRPMGADERCVDCTRRLAV